MSAPSIRVPGRARPALSSPALMWLRASMVVVALLTSAAHLFALPGATREVTFWLETEVVGYLIVAVVYLLGLRSWYGLTIGYSALNAFIYFLSAVVVLPGITHSDLVGHLEFAQYSFGRGFSVAGWAYLLAVGAVLEHLDPGSRLDELLRLTPRVHPSGAATLAAPRAASVATAEVRPARTAVAVDTWAGSVPLTGTGAGLFLLGAVAALTVVGAGIGVLFMATGLVLLLAEGVRRLVVRATHPPTPPRRPHPL